MLCAAASGSKCNMDSHQNSSIVHVGDYEYNTRDLIGHGAFAVVFKGRQRKVYRPSKLEINIANFYPSIDFFHSHLLSISLLLHLFRLDNTFSSDSHAHSKFKHSIEEIQTKHTYAKYKKLLCRNVIDISLSQRRRKLISVHSQIFSASVFLFLSMFCFARLVRLNNCVCVCFVKPVLSTTPNC